MSLGYRPKLRGGWLKDVMYGISANYKPDDNNPVDGTNVINWAFSDDSGLISFPFLWFSDFGYTGKYRLMYYCSGTSKPSNQETTVSSSIDSISFASPHATEITFLNPWDVDYHFNFWVLIKDSNNNGIYGKTASSVIVSEVESSINGFDTNSIVV